MYIYLPDGFISFPKILGGFVESIVTSINCYFLVIVSENGCVHCFFILLWFFWFAFGFFFFRVNHRMVKKKVTFGQWLLQLDITFIRPSKEVCFSLFCSTCLKNRDFISSLKKAFYYSYKSLQRAQNSS